MMMMRQVVHVRTVMLTVLPGLQQENAAETLHL